MFTIIKLELLPFIYITVYTNQFSIGNSELQLVIYINFIPINIIGAINIDNVIVIPFTDSVFTMPSVLVVEKVVFSLTYC